MYKLFNWTAKSSQRNEISSVYEPIQPYLFLSFIEYLNAEVVLDVGANIGLYSIFSSMCDSVSKIYAFEPEVEAFNELVNNVSINGLRELLALECRPVSDTEAKQLFGVHSPLSGINGIIDSSIHDPSLFQELIEVEGITLDSICNYERTVIAIKIDVEGHELRALKGAKKLLKKNPVLIQVEHYIGVELDTFLAEFGFFRFHSAGHDHYYSNIKNFRNIEFVSKAISHAHAMLIDYNTGTYSNNNTLSQSLNLEFEINSGKLNAKASLKIARYFEENVEYAFYLLFKGKKHDAQWYSGDNTYSVELPKEFSGYSLKAFVREVGVPEKIASKEISLGAENSMRCGAKAATPNSYVAPHLKVDNRFFVGCQSYELDFSKILQERAFHLVLVGANYLDYSTITTLSNEFKKLTLIEVNQDDNKRQLKSRNSFNNIAISSESELLMQLREIEKDVAEKACYVILSELFNYISFSESLIKEVIRAGRKGDIIATQELTNKSYREMLAKYVNEQKLTLQLLQPKSSISQCNKDVEHPQTEKKYESCSSVISKLDFKL